MRLTIEDVIEYCRTQTPFDSGASFEELYGTERFNTFLYSVIRAARPERIVELGTGIGTTTLWAALAIQENGAGHLWTIDDGTDWPEIATCVHRIPWAEPGTRTAHEFYRRFFERFGLDPFVTFVDVHLDRASFYSPPGEGGIDMLYADATDVSAKGCVELLKYYLPQMNYASSIFIDRAATINHARLVIDFLVEQLNVGKVPCSLLSADDQARNDRLVELASVCRFQAVHLGERPPKINEHQNGRSWIRIEPNDFRILNGVINF